METLAYSYDNAILPIDHIDFDIFKNKEILEGSALDSNTNGVEFAETYMDGKPKTNGVIDARMGTTNDDIYCLTCGFGKKYCPGHFGHMKLANKMLQIIYAQTVKQICDCICMNCSKLLIHKNEKLIDDVMKIKTGYSRLTEIRELTKNITECNILNNNCSTPVSKIRLEIKKSSNSIKFYTVLDLSKIKDESVQISGKSKSDPLDTDVLYEKLKNISDDDCRILGINPERSRPEDMIHVIFPVPPVQIRPSVKGEFMGGSTKEDDLTGRIIEITKANQRLRKYTESVSENSRGHIQRHTELAQYQISSYVDAQMIGLQKMDQKMKTYKYLVVRIKSKEGIIRCNLMGKRVDFSARTVITSNPAIDNNQVSIPLRTAIINTFPETVTPYNIEYLTELVRRGRDNYPGANYVIPINKPDGQPIDLRFRKEQIELQYGDKVERHMQDGDIVLLNRQPSLHKQSMMGHRAKVINDPELMVFGLSVAVTTPYNADFDGELKSRINI